MKLTKRKPLTLRQQLALSIGIEKRRKKRKDGHACGVPKLN